MSAVSVDKELESFSGTVSILLFRTLRLPAIVSEQYAFVGRRRRVALRLSLSTSLMSGTHGGVRVESG